MSLQRYIQFAKKEGKRLWEGCKMSYQDYKHTQEIKHMVTQKRFTEITRPEYVRYVYAKQDLMKNIPIGILTILPFHIITVPYWLNKFPGWAGRRFLTDHQKEELRISSWEKMVSSMDFIPRYFLGNCPSIWRPIIKSNFEPGQEFDFPKLTDHHIHFLARTANLSDLPPTYFMRKRLLEKAEFWRNDDNYLHEIGVDSLSDNEVKEACFDRSLDPEEDDPREQLKTWLSLVKSEDSDSWILHVPSLIETDRLKKIDKLTE